MLPKTLGLCIFIFVISNNFSIFGFLLPNEFDIKYAERIFKNSFLFTVEFLKSLIGRDDTIVLNFSRLHRITPDFLSGIIARHREINHLDRCNFFCNI